MSMSTVASERLTAVLSTVVAIGILGAAVTAQQSGPAAQDEVSRLESDLRYQLKRAARFNGQKAATCTAQLDKAVELWHQVEPSEGNQRLFARWLRDSIIQTMPGSEMHLPEAPAFSSGPQAAPSETPATLDTPQPIAAEQPTVAARETHPVQADDAVISQNQAAASLPRPADPTPAMQPLVNITTQPFPARKENDRKAWQPLDVEINLSELTARTAGYHDGLDQVEAALLATSMPNDSQFATQVGRLHSLARDYRFVRLYYNSLSDRERSSVIAPRPLGTTLAKLRRQLDRSDTGEQFAPLRQQLDSIAQLAD